MTEINSHARTVLEHTVYAVLATADSAGNPWVTPVWFAPDGLDRLYWVSSPDSRHSLLIEERPAIALTVFDSTVAAHEGTAFYATALARRCPHEDLDLGLHFFNRRAVEHGIDPLTRDLITGAGRLRLYLADVNEAWVLDQDADVDQRAGVPR